MRLRLMDKGDFIRGVKKELDVVREGFVSIRNEIEKVPHKVAETYKDYELILVNKGILSKFKDIDNKIDKVLDDWKNTKDRLEFRLNHILKEEDGYELQFEDGKVCIEDELFHKVSDAIAKHHAYKFIKVEFHKRVRGFEYDCIIECETDWRKLKRYVGIEFKESDVNKVVAQAIERHGNMNLQYIALSSDVAWVVSNMPIERLKKMGIGVIAMYGEKPVFILESKTNRRNLEKWM